MAQKGVKGSALVAPQCETLSGVQWAALQPFGGIVKGKALNPSSTTK